MLRRYTQQKKQSTFYFILSSLLSQDLSIVKSLKLFKSNLLIRLQIPKVLETSFNPNLIGTSLHPQTFGLLGQKSMDQMFL